MDLAEIARVMRRRWYVLLPGLLVTAVLVVGVFLVVPTKYQSQSTVELLNSQKATVDFDGNPFLSTQTSLTGMADSLARNVNSDAAIADLKSQGLTGTYVAMIADNAQGPLMWLTVTGTDQAAVLKSDQLLTAYTAQRLQQFQAQQSVAADAMIRMTTIVPPQNPVAQLKTKIEYLIMAGLLGVVVSMVGTFYVEARRRPQPTVRPADDELAPVSAEDDDEDEDDGPDGQHGAAGDGSVPAPRQQRPRPQDEDIEQPTVQLALLQSHEHGNQKGDRTKAPWFSP
ncbi:chain length determinant protein [Streptacidiphilus cavernicola]|uniref:Chain length determinant protein n=1 Tax=Streptacidiphilus cavernicola TaxID=3342716 RepID=A0ABV6W124_9ACTN